MSIYSNLFKSMVKREQSKTNRQPNKHRDVCVKPVVEEINKSKDLSVAWIHNMKNKVKDESKNYEINDNSDLGKIVLEKMKKIKLKTFIDDYKVDTENGTVSYKNVPEIVLDKNAIGKISSGVDIIKNTQTTSIHDVFELNNYDKVRNTIDVDGHTIKIEDLLNLERVLVHYF